jgi:hypothetical protein
METTKTQTGQSKQIKSPLWLKYRPGFDNSDEMILIKEESVLYYAYYNLLFNFLARQCFCEFSVKTAIDYRKLMNALKIKTREELTDFFNYLIELELLIFDGEKLFMPHLKEWSEPYFKKLETDKKSKRKSDEKKRKKMQLKKRKKAVKTDTNKGGAESVPTRHAIEVEREVEREREKEVEKEKEKEEREYIEETTFFDSNCGCEVEKEKPLTTQNEGPKNFTEKVKLMKSILSDSESEVKEKKEAPEKTRANLFQGKINIQKEFSFFREYIKTNFQFFVSEENFKTFLSWFNATKARRKKNPISYKIPKSLFCDLIDEFISSFLKVFKEKQEHEKTVAAIKSADEKEDSLLKNKEIPDFQDINKLLDSIEEKLH